MNIYIVTFFEITQSALLHIYNTQIMKEELWRSYCWRSYGWRSYYWRSYYGNLGDNRHTLTSGKFVLVKYINALETCFFLTNGHLFLTQYLQQ